jgi:hypothetical protein
MKRRVGMWVSLVLVAALATPAFADHQPEFRNLKQKVKNLKKRVAALEQTDPVPGPKGEKGDKGEPGDPGGVSGYARVSTVTTWPSSGQHLRAHAYCPPGLRVVGGGYAGNGNDVRKSRPKTVPGSINPFADLWTIGGRNRTSEDRPVVVYAICVEEAA